MKIFFDNLKKILMMKFDIYLGSLEWFKVYSLPYLGVFSTRLDFNRFLTNNNGSFGNSRDTKILKTFFFLFLSFFFCLIMK